MNKIFLLVVSISICSSCISQVKVIKNRTSFNQSEFEIGLTANLGKRITKATEILNNYNYMDPTLQNYSHEYSYDDAFIMIGVVLGYYILDGLSVEPEVNLNLGSEGFKVSLIGNLNYSFSIPQKNVFPFIKLGYGVSNYQSGFTNKSTELFESFNLATINAGAGVKLLYSSGMIIRMEINYRDLSGKNIDTPHHGSGKNDVKISLVSFLIGMAVII